MRAIILCVILCLFGACTSDGADPSTAAIDQEMMTLSTWCDGDNRCSEVFDYACQCIRVYCVWDRTCTEQGACENDGGTWERCGAQMCCRPPDTQMW